MRSEKKPSVILRITRLIPPVLIGLFFLSIVSIMIIGFSVPKPEEEITPAGYHRFQSLYVSMTDETRLAVDLWLPPTLSGDQKIPSVLLPNRFWRSQSIQGLGGRILVGLGLESYQTPLFAALNEAGYAVVSMDLRGTGASFGHRLSEFPEKDVEDLVELMDWILLQPWSDGLIAAAGEGFNGLLVERLAAKGHPALAAVSPQFSSFDGYLNFPFPGGVFAREVALAWQIEKDLYDSNQVCQLKKWQGWFCEFASFFLISGVKPAGDDYDQSQLAQALQERGNFGLYDRLEQTVYRDDPIDRYGQSLADISPFSHQAGLENSGVPYFVVVSWLDAGTADGAVSRYLTLTNPQTVLIGPWSHGGKIFNDPLLQGSSQFDKNQQEQMQSLIQFFDEIVKGGNNQQSGKSHIIYYTIGEGAWRTTQTWPPDGIESLQLYLSSQNQLSAEKPDLAEGFDPLPSGENSGTGTSNRWWTHQTGQAVQYPMDPSRRDGYLTYISSPLEQSLEITGTPVITLFITSAHREANLFIYLESIDQRGNIRYITEGILSSRHQRIQNEPPAYLHPGPNRTFSEKERQFFEDESITEIQIPLFTTSAYLQHGSRIQISIASQDVETFGDLITGNPGLVIHRSLYHPSGIHLPGIYR